MHNNYYCEQYAAVPTGSHYFIKYSAAIGMIDMTNWISCTDV